MQCSGGDSVGPFFTSHQNNLQNATSNPSLHSWSLQTSTHEGKWNRNSNLESPRGGSAAVLLLLPKLLHHLKVGPSARPSDVWGKKLRNSFKSFLNQLKPFLNLFKPNLFKHCLNLLKYGFRQVSDTFRLEKNNKIEKVMKINFCSTYRLESLWRIRIWEPQDWFI